jgi:hypothetical protein
MSRADKGLVAWRAPCRGTGIANPCEVEVNLLKQSEAIYADISDVPQGTAERCRDVGRRSFTCPHAVGGGVRTSVRSKRRKMPGSFSLELQTLLLRMGEFEADKRGSVAR